MNLKVLTTIAFVLMFSFFTSSMTYAQKQTLIGLNLNSNIYPDEISLNRVNIGATFETQLGKHSGGETGIYYHSKYSTNITSYTDASGSHSYSSTVARRYLTVPVLYKYYSKRINFSVGPSFDFYLGWKQKEDGSPVQIQSFTVNPKVRIGFLTKVSRSIPVSEKFIIEPELRFGSVQTIDQANVGLGIAGKYRF